MSVTPANADQIFGNYTGENHLGEAVELEPHEPVELGQFPLETSEAVRQKLGVAFDAELRAVFELAPDRGEETLQVFLLDRGNEKNEPVPVVDGPAEQRTLLMRKRYILVTDKGLGEIVSAAERGHSYSGVGIYGFNTGDTFIVGRNDQEKFREDFPVTVSRNHLMLKASANGHVKVTDLGSTNGTRLISNPR